MTTTRLKNIPANIPSLLNVLVMGLLAGLSFCVQFGLLPVLDRMDAASYVSTMQGIIPLFTHLAGPLMMIGLVTFTVRLTVLRSPCAGMQYWNLAALGCFITAGVITIAGHWPMNAQVLHWSPQNPPIGWETLRQKWDALNLWRYIAAQLGFLAVLVPFVFARNRLTTEAISSTD